MSTTSLSCISMKNQASKARPEIFNVNSNNPVFYPFSIKTSKCSGNRNNINDPYAKICVPDVVKYLNVKVLNGSNLAEEKGVLYFFLLYIKLFYYIKMGESADSTYYQKIRHVILNRAKDYYEKDKERLRRQARDK